MKNKYNLYIKKGDGINWSDLSLSPGEFNLAFSIMINLANCLIYTLLSIYFEEIMPRKWGKSQHILYCLGFKRQKSNKG